MSLTTQQLRNIVVTERISSIFSLVGAAFVILTFVLNDKFRKPINRLVFYATFGNILTNVATLVSTSGIEAGTNSPLCQFQAFLLQWFMPADALWTFAMACNVWLSFFRAYDTSALRRLEWKYIVACYGVPFVPGFVYIFVNTQERRKVYGAAVLWCWVSLRWDFLRVATFYGPVWVVILATIGIYIRVGSIIFKWRRQLLSMEKERTLSGTNEYPAIGILKTSEIIVTRTETVVSGEEPDFGNDLHSKASFSRTIQPTRPITMVRMSRPSGGIDPNKAAVKYCKCAMLFFLALIVTWVPSTVNRIYTIIRPDEVVYGLHLAAALVLPLQGFWNALIYLATSTFAMRCLWQDILDVCRSSSPRQMAIQVRRQGVSIHSSELEDRSRKFSSGQTPYDADRASSQSELVGQAK
ncbi:hypothetical protein LTS08_001506 [Lithohypha guttulata]|nr:hypothetical protein LTS08_001506 [Lithohypha guttulata]